MPFLTSLPREVRDLIYFHVLVSPTGVVTVPHSIDWQKWQPTTTSITLAFEVFNPDPHGAYKAYTQIILSLPQVCKQIREECEHIFWEHNTLRIPRMQYTARRGLTSEAMSVGGLNERREVVPLMPALWSRLVHIELHIASDSAIAFDTLSSGLPYLKILTATGPLKTLTVVIDIWARFRFIKFNAQVISRIWATWERNLVYRTPIDNLRNALAGDDGFAPHVDIKIVLETGWAYPLTSLNSERVEAARLLEPVGFIAGMHSILGGELLLDDVLMSKDGVKVS